MKKLLRLCRANPGLSLLAINVSLFLVYVLIQDPFGLIKTGYAGSRSVIRVSQDSVSVIEIENPDKGLFVLTRKDPIKTDSKDKDAKKDYTWAMSRQISGKTETFEGDAERIRDLFSSIEKAHRYYSIARTTENEKIAEMGADASGKLACVQIHLKTPDGKTNTLYVGKSSLRGNDSYVRLNDEDKIYLVEENLRTSSGAADVDFFRNRRVLPIIPKEKITGINATLSGKPMQLSYAGDQWRMLVPIQAALSASEMSLLLGDILDWKASAFPTQLPKELDRKKAMSLEIVYKPNMTDSQSLKFEILGQKDYSSYIVKDAAGILYEVNSAYLNNLFDPRERLIEKSDRHQ